MSTPKFPTLKEQEGEVITILSPLLDETTLQRVRLIRVEDAGLWIEHHEIRSQLMTLVRTSSASSSPPVPAVLFLPWHQIVTILRS